MNTRPLLLIFLYTALLAEGKNSFVAAARRNLERGKLLSSSLRADDLYQAYLQTRNDYQDKLTSKEKRWRVVARSSESNVTVSILNHPDDPHCPYVKMDMVVPVPVDDVCDFLSTSQWDRNMPKVDPYFEGVQIYKDFVHRGADILLCRKRSKRLGGLFGKRDFVLLSVEERDPHPATGARIATTVSIRTPKFPRMPGYTRAYHDSYAMYRPVQNGDATHVTTVLRFDLNDSAEDGEGGNVPMWIYAKTVGRLSAKSCDLICQTLVREKQRKR